MLLQTAGILLMLMLSLLVGQCLYFRSTIYSYTDMAQYNLAHALKNIAQANQLTDGKTLTFNQGNVTLTKGKYQVILSTGRKFEFM